MPAPIAVPAAPAPAPTGNGVQTSAPPAARNTSGQFSPKDGAAGVETKAPAETKAPEAKGPPGETAAEKVLRLKGKLKRRGKELDVDLSPEEAMRALQVAWDLEEKRGEITNDRKTVDELLQGLKTKPRETLRAQGVDLDELLANEAAEREKLATMSEDAQRAYRLEQELNALKGERETEKKTLAQQQRQAQRQAEVQRNLTSYKAALKSSALPAESPALLRMMVDTQDLIVSGGRPPLEPQQLAQATERRHLLELDEVANAVAKSPEAAARWRPALQKFAKLGLSGLKGKPLLDALGTELVVSVCQATLESHGHAPIAAPPTDAPPPAPASGKALTEAEARELLRRA